MSAHQGAPRLPEHRWQTLLTWGIVAALLALAIWMRLYNLGQPFDHDGYDEGVYWQTLRSMSAGYTLYQQIFYSQPPFFILSVYPFFALLGHTLWSARFGIAMLSLAGLPGAFMLGKALQGRISALVAMFLLILDPLYFSLSQKIQAEVPSAAFSFLAVGAAYLWWENPDTTSGLFLAALAGIALVLSILCKLLAVSSIVPIGLLVLARLWQIFSKQHGTSRRSWYAIAALILASIVTSALLFLPFLGAPGNTISDVITFHTQAKAALINSQVLNANMVRDFIRSALPLLIAAAFGTIVAIIRGDWRVFPLLAWGLVTLILLWEQVPLFPRHFVTLIPILISLAILGFGYVGQVKASLTNITFGQVKASLSSITFRHVLTAVAALLLLVVVYVDVPQYPPYYRMVARQGSNGTAQFQAHVANDLRNSITPNQLVITDGQFVAALADRNTPPALVDTSLVRVDAGYLTLRQLLDIASQPQVHAVLFFTNRLYQSQLAGFHPWVTQHFHLKYNYGHSQELWVR
ncbi:MAG: ArnT family glycosyltransferase [Ktedonobacteraceae bacterium]